MDGGGPRPTYVFDFRRTEPNPKLPKPTTPIQPVTDRCHAGRNRFPGSSPSPAHALCRMSARFRSRAKRSSRQAVSSLDKPKNSLPTADTHNPPSPPPVHNSSVISSVQATSQHHNKNNKTSFLHPQSRPLKHPRPCALTLFRPD